MINSLTARIFAIFWLTLALVLLGVLQAPKLDDRQIAELADSDRRQGVELAEHIQKDLLAAPLQDFFWWQRLFRIIRKWEPPEQRLLLVTSEGRVIGIQHNELQLIRIARNFIGQSDNPESPRKKKYGRLEVTGPFIVNDSDESYLLYQIRQASSPQSDFFNLLFDRPLLLLLVTMMISSPLLLWLSWSLAKPARKLKRAADNVAGGQLQTHPELESGPLEFRAAGTSFNQMVSTLAQMVSAQRRLISDISHELRTPLTRLQLAAALMRRRYGEGHELERIETEARRLDNMINELLTLSYNQYKQVTKETLDSEILWQSVLDNALFEAEQVGKQLTVTALPGNWPLYGNAASLESALENVIRNALRYSTARIEILFRKEKKGIAIYVDDDGPGVAEEDREQIFHPFFRTDEARDRASGGTGLGLAIVKMVVDQHHGYVKAQESPLGGLRLLLWLPLKPD
ncbi:MAG: envelope stress sensor histidine kinase CpxA [Enterobacteriaceae bacterium]